MSDGARVRLARMSEASAEGKNAPPRSKPLPLWVRATVALLTVAVVGSGCGRTVSGSKGPSSTTTVARHGKGATGVPPTSALGLAPTTSSSSTAPPAPTVPYPTSAPNGIVIRVTGTGEASVTIIDGTNPPTQSDETLPYMRTLTDSPSSVSVSAESSDPSPSASIACEIDAPGVRPATDSAMGAFSVVTCGIATGH